MKKIMVKKNPDEDNYSEKNLMKNKLIIIFFEVVNLRTSFFKGAIIDNVFLRKQF